MKATVPPRHGRLTKPERCLCEWKLHPATDLSPTWWEMSERLRGCLIHRFPEEKTRIDQAVALRADMDDIAEVALA